MFKRIRKLAVALLLFVLPWQPLATGMPVAIDHLIDMRDDARGTDKSHHDGAGHRNYLQHAHGVTMLADGGNAPSDAIQSGCSDACCFPALAGVSGLPFAAFLHHGLVIPFPASTLRWRAPDSIDHPPRRLLA
jgi:hypothetical protein